MNPVGPLTEHGTIPPNHFISLIKARSSKKPLTADANEEAGIIYSLVLLLHVIANVNYLQDVVVGTELQRTNVDLDVVLQEVLSQLANFFRPGGAPHQGLTVWLGCQTFLKEVRSYYLRRHHHQNEEGTSHDTNQAAGARAAADTERSGTAILPPAGREAETIPDAPEQTHVVV
ncbi:hypothetical protein EYF80_020348 [Liparis tanakae]|uniref:Uncharacterized protein n=1 Tax=Liparis tanakae TaxID=230148 RepID=A0A4Z2HWW7_9TELE|nr:hypothetical protein EYF80_020348 [Liparis tanakae]